MCLELCSLDFWWTFEILLIIFLFLSDRLILVLQGLCTRILSVARDVPGNLCRIAFRRMLNVRSRVLVTQIPVNELRASTSGQVYRRRWCATPLLYCFGEIPYRYLLSPGKRHLLHLIIEGLVAAGKAVMSQASFSCFGGTSRRWPRLLPEGMHVFMPEGQGPSQWVSK